MQAHEHEHDVVTAKKAARLPAAPRASSTPPTRAQRPDATTAVPAPEQTESPGKCIRSRYASACRSCPCSSSQLYTLPLKNTPNLRKMIL